MKALVLCSDVKGNTLSKQTRNGTYLDMCKVYLHSFFYLFLLITT